MSNEIDYSRISETLGKMAHYLGNHNCIGVGVSGGSDSTIIVHMLATYFRQHLPKIHFVFCDTGLEYQATRRFIKELEAKYDIEIETVRGVPIPLAVKREGVPILSKKFSQTVGAYVRKVPYAVERVEHSDKFDSRSKAHLSDTEVAIAKEVEKRGLLVSDKCCYLSKKQPSDRHYKELGVDLHVTGERRAEGGVRAVVNTSCFMPNVHGRDHYMPLFFWNDATKAYYKESEGIRYSDCYEVWGMKRTGCVGCPCNSRVGEDLKMIEKYEPKLYKACINIFGESYRLMDEFCTRRKTRILEEQLTMEGF